MDELCNENSGDDLSCLKKYNFHAKLSKVHFTKDNSLEADRWVSRDTYSSCRDTEASSILNSTLQISTTNLHTGMKSCIRGEGGMASSKSVKFLVQNETGEDMILEKSELSEPESEFDSFILYGI